MTHQHAGYDPGEAPGCVEIDPHVCLLPIGSSSSSSAAQELAGFIFGHDREGFEVRCEGFVRVKPEPGQNCWGMTGTLEGGDLTLSPSILCRLGNVANQPCGYHGFVQQGKWVPA